MFQYFKKKSANEKTRLFLAKFETKNTPTHSHHHTDWITIVGYLGRSVIYYAANTLAIAQMLDLLTNLEPDEHIPASLPGLVTGAVLAVPSTIALAWCSRNMYVQKKAEHEQLASEQSLIHLNPQSKFTKKQNAALLGYYFTCITDYTELFFLLSEHVFLMSRPVKIGALAASLLGGSLAAYADYRAAKQIIERYLGMELTQSKGSDFFVKFSTGMETVTSFLAGFFWAGELIDLIFDLEPEFLNTLSYPGLAVGTAVALYGALGAGFCHWVFNTHDHHHHHYPAISHSGSEAISQEEVEVGANSQSIERIQHRHGLSFWQSIAIGGDWLMHAFNPAEVALLMAALFSDRHMSREAEITTVLLCTALGGLIGIADARMCKHTIEAHTAAKQQPRSVEMRDLYQSSSTHDEVSISFRSTQLQR